MAQDNPTKGFSLKDQLFNEDKVRYLAGLFAAQDPSFPSQDFVADVMEDMLTLELKARLQLISQVLERYLPPHYPTAIAQILTSLPPLLDPTKTDDDFGDFIFAPLGDFVARRGLDDFDVSMKALEELTQRFSMEDSIRAFINAYPDQTFAQFEDWKTHVSYHVRRLVSEGSRPLLPWSGRLKTKIDRAIPLLDHLHADKTRYVTRSVANHLNDIAKKDPPLVVKTLGRWQQEHKQTAKELAWMTKHALRTLIKKGDPAALELLGYRQSPDVEITSLTLSEASVEIGEQLKFDVTLKANTPERLMVDYVIDFVKANGKTAPKVFKLKQLAVQAGESMTVSKTHRFLADASTFKIFAGTHRLSIQVNGTVMAQQTFELT